jgi:photosystem II stability/assembly factor-like uncharacterized protein
MVSNRHLSSPGVHVSPGRSFKVLHEMTRRDPPFKPLRARTLRASALALTLALGVSLAPAQEPLALPDNFVSQMIWRSIGPATMGGRVIRLQVDESNPKTWYVATASGGLWKTTDAGESFEGLFQNEEVNSIGCVAVSKSRPDVVWIGTGENNPRNSSIYGKGVYKSTDGGKTWQNMGLLETRHVGRVVIHPTNPDIVYVGAMGRTWGRNEERGLFKTTDGGQTWEKVLYVDDQTGVIDVQVNPSDPNIMLAATWQRQRDIFDTGEPAMSDGPGSGIWRSTDAGRTWNKLGAENGLPTGSLGRTGIDFHRNDPKIAYLITGSARQPRDKNGVWKSVDGGETWEKVNDIAPRPMYYSKLRVDPNNPDIVFVLGVQMARSEDGGKTFRNLPMRGVHVDHHCLWINPADSQHILLGNDGGFYESRDGANTFRAHKKMAIGQFYHVAVDQRRDYAVSGGLQDNGTYYGPSLKRGEEGPSNRDFRSIGGGDGFVVRIDPRDHNLVYLESQNGNIRRTYLGQRENAPQGTMRRPAAPNGGREAWAWKTDFILCHTNPDVYYTAGEYVYKSTNKGVDLERISPRIPRTTRGSGTAINVSPLNPDVLYAGTDDGALWVTRDGGENWTRIHGNVSLPKPMYVSTIEPSRYVEGRCYVAFDGHRSDDEAPFLYVTEDFGQTWTSLNANLPEFGSTRALREDTQNPNLLYCGTEFFTYASIDRGRTWNRINNNLPTVAVHDFAISDAAAELVAGTHGRSLWILDIAWLRQASPDSLGADTYFFQPHSAVLWNEPEERVQPPRGVFIGENPPFGALLYYSLKVPTTGIELVVSDAEGKEVARIAGTGEVGLNRVLWGLESQGERVQPGTYKVTLRAGAQTIERQLVVEPDPSSRV